MSRLQFKGGPWTNTEDQFLLAALSKYGLRDWARVASVLQNKTAQQCRERYENYLDDRLNLTEEWSLEEEEELLKLQSLFPYKWRTIAEQLTRRTPTHYRRPPWLCEQHYQKLLDAHEFEKKQAAAQRDGEPELSFGAFMEERRRRRGRQLAHEERAARADTAATATEKREAHDLLVSRLANQDQKKGLRKQRKLQQQETSYLAKLENNREAIEAGTLSGRQRKRMRQAMEEDQRGRATVLDRIVEDDEDEGDDDESLLAVEDADMNDEDDTARRRPRGKASRRGEEGSTAFTPIDMLDDQAKAGIEKRTRKLYGGHIESTMGDGAPAGADGALPIHHSLLDQLVSGGADIKRLGGGTSHEEAKRLTSSTASITPEATSSSARADRATSSAITWDALAGPSTDVPDLDTLFAALPEASESAPRHVKKDKTVAPTATHVDDVLTSLPAPEDGDTGSRVARQAPATVATTVPRTGPVAASAPETKTVVRVRSPEEYAVLAKEAIDEMMGSPESLAPARHDEVFMRALGEARQAVEAETQRRASLSSSSSITPEIVAETQREMGTWAHVTVREDERAMLAARLSDEVQIASARRRGAYTRLEKLVSQCFIDPRDSVLAGGLYLSQGTAEHASAAVDESDNHAADDSSSAAPGTVLHYAAQYWANELHRRTGQCALLRRLREEEVVAMQHKLDALETALSAAQHEERRLQAEYRERQRRAHLPNGTA